MQTYAYYVRHKNGWGTGTGPRPTHCHECRAELPQCVDGAGAAGYGCGIEQDVPARVLLSLGAGPLKAGERITRAPAVCYACCGAHDKAEMIETGRAVLYLSKRPDGTWHIGNWPGSLSFPVRHNYVRKGSHNIARTRYDAWFIGPDGKEWHAVNIGDNQIARCRRIKSK